MNSDDFKAEYDHKKIEKKWQFFWEKNKSFFVDLENFDKPKKYILSMFPYPSGSGLHVGHVRNYTIADASARLYRMLGFNVLFPIGWDSFGLPSEQYAIETNKHPSDFTYKNIENFKKQLLSLGFSYDWSKEINTIEPSYYSITQWMFKQIINEGLAEYKNHPVFWCNALSTVLSNEEIKTVDGKMFSERGNFPVEKRNIKQWIVKITEYSKSLSDGLEIIDWPISIKNLQKNWIGYAEGVKISFPVVGKEFFLDIFTTRIDTVYGANSIVISFSNFFCDQLLKNENREKFVKFRDLWKNYSEQDILEKVDGFFTGSYCLNPFNNEKIPVWITNFVVDDYGTGCLMISPFDSETIKEICKNGSSFFTKKEASQNLKVDYNFSNKFGLQIKKIVSFSQQWKRYEYINSPIINQLDDKIDARKKLLEFALEKGIGSKTFSSHLKDWVFSRQRYWGEPIPVVHLKNEEKYLISDEELPLKLPYLDDFAPSPEFYSPLQKLNSWISFKNNKVEGLRDVNVMPQWAGSCWYFIAFLIVKKNHLEESVYLNPKDEKVKKLLDYWLPIDLYIGGQEHANLHLLYARFWNRFLSEKGLTIHKEPFKKLLCQGMILSKDGSKMSKSKGNVVNPDNCIEKWGADSLRLYEMFVSSPSQTAYFNIDAISPMRKWISKVFNFFVKENNSFFEKGIEESEENLNNILIKISKNYQLLKFNLVVSNLMEFMNEMRSLSSQKKISFSYAKTFLQLLNPLTPHVSEEIWDIIKKRCGEEGYISNSLLEIEKFRNTKVFKKTKIIVKINNKFKTNIFILESDNNEKKIIGILKEGGFLKNEENLKVFFVKGKIINIIIS